MTTEAIQVESLTKKFDGLAAVDNVTFSVEKGELFAFLGPNGAGKTTTIKMLTTLLSPTSGHALVNGFDVAAQKEDVRKSFGIVFQDQSLDDELTTYENMNFHAMLYKIPPQVRKKRIKELLEFVQLWERKNALVKTFSGGMKRRLEIARGLLHHPKIFFLDEPTIGLDPQTRNHIWEYVKNLAKKEGITIFFTTHYMEEAEMVADKVAIMDHGKIMTIGTVKQILSETKTTTLEKAFLKLTGNVIRDEEANAMESLRQNRTLWRGKGR